MNEILTPESKKFLDIVDLIQKSHIKTAESAIPQDTEVNKKICEELQHDITEECENIKKFMKAAEVYIYILLWYIFFNFRSKYIYKIKYLIYYYLNITL